MKVLVAGAGPAGAATALLLARCGLDVTLVERERSFERVFRGEDHALQRLVPASDFSLFIARL